MPFLYNKCAYCGHDYGIHFMEPGGSACPVQPGVKAVPPGNAGWFQQTLWVKCIDATDMGSGKPALTRLKVYKVLSESQDSYNVINDNGAQKAFLKGRFLATQDPNTGAGAPVVQQAAARPTTKDVDVSDWRAWSNKTPGQCPCGIAKSQCDYHKDARS